DAAEIDLGAAESDVALVHDLDDPAWNCKTHRRVSSGPTSAAKAAADFAGLTARLEAAPFQSSRTTRVFQQPVNSCGAGTRVARALLPATLANTHSNSAVRKNSCADGS